MVEVKTFPAWLQVVGGIVGAGAIVALLTFFSDGEEPKGAVSPDIDCLDYKYRVREKAADRIMTAINDRGTLSFNMKRATIGDSFDGDGEEFVVWFEANDADGQLSDMIAVGEIDPVTCEVGTMTGQVGGVLHDGVTPTFQIR